MAIPTDFPTNNVTYARNTVPAIKLIDVSDAVVATLTSYGDNAPLYTTSYQPDFDGNVCIDFAGIYEDLLKTELPNVGAHKTQYFHRLPFMATITETDGTVIAAYTYWVCNALYLGVENFEDFASSHFLTNQPAEKRTDRYSPEYLTWFDHQGDWTLKVRFYPKDGGYSDHTVVADNGIGVFSHDVSYRKVIKKSINYLPKQLQGYYDLIMFNSKGEAIMLQRYIYEERTGLEHYYLFVNALGGIDTLVCVGGCALQPDLAFNTGRFANRNAALDDTENRRKWRQSVGLMPWREREWLYELVSSKRDAMRYLPVSGLQQDIVVVELDIDVTDSEQLAPASFGFILAETVNAIHQSERDSTLHASTANAAEEGEDLTVQAVVEFAPAQGGGFVTEPVTVYNDRCYITVGGTDTVYMQIGDDPDLVEIDPTVRMPVIFEFGLGETPTLIFSCQSNPGTVTVNYYPDEYVEPGETAMAQEPTES